MLSLNCWAIKIKAKNKQGGNALRESNLVCVCVCASFPFMYDKHYNKTKDNNRSFLIYTITNCYKRSIALKNIHKIDKHAKGNK